MQRKARSKYMQNNPVPITGCGRRRLEEMENPFKKKEAKSILEKIQNKTYEIKKLSTENKELYGSVKPTEIAKLIKEIEDKLMTLRGQGAVKPLKMKATEEQIKKGAPVTYEVPVTFDTSNFFV